MIMEAKLNAAQGGDKKPMRELMRKFAHGLVQHDKQLLKMTSALERRKAHQEQQGEMNAELVQTGDSNELDAAADQSQQQQQQDEQ